MHRTQLRERRGIQFQVRAPMCLVSPGTEPVPHVYRLHYGKSTKALAEVIPDDEYAGMWRIRWPDGRVSDMVNLTRAKDAACVLAMRVLPTGNAKPLRWDKA